jgi:hypothetical protein
MMPLLASRHAAFETVGQIGIADFVQSGDDLLLDGVGDFHFALRGHAGIYVARTSEPNSRRNVSGRGDDGGLRGVLERPGNVLRGFLSRCAYGTSIRNSAAVSVAEVDTDDRRVGVNGKAENLALKADNDT